MSAPRIYMDYNATAPMREDVRRAMSDAFAITGNPSSVHHEGRRARAAVERARAQVAALAGCEPGEVVFTASGTEANNMVLRQESWNLLLISAIEHDSVLAPARASGRPVEMIPVLEDGRIDTNWLGKRLGVLDGDSGNVLVALQAANNETGIIQPVDEAARIAAEHGCALHVDAVQAAGRMPLDFMNSGAAFMALSAHKIGGPKGIGALILRGNRKLAALVRGGGQESGRRAGTENVPAIVGFGAAAEQAARELDRMAEAARLRDRLEDGVRAVTSNAVVIGEACGRLANTSCIALPGAKAETLVIALDLAGIAVSAGAACSSGKVSRSHVLDAMGLPGGIAEGAIRVSIASETNERDIDRFLEAWSNVTAARTQSVSVA